MSLCLGLPAPFLCAVLVLIAVPGAKFEGYYTITAADTIRPNTAYRVAITYQSHPDRYDSPYSRQLDMAVAQGNGSVFGPRVSVTVSGTGEDGLHYQSSALDVSTPFGNTTTVQLQIRNWPAGVYRLDITGRAPRDFHRFRDLLYNPKKFSVFVQSDKMVYQPRQTVRFRVFAINSDLLPFAGQNYSIYINDADNNRIKQWNGVLDRFATFQGQLILSESPVTGLWVISADIGSETTASQFTVKDYVLPRFEVVIRAPSYVAISHPKIHISVEATYTFGGLVKGSLRLSVMETYCTISWAVCKSTPIVIQQQLNGTAHFEIDVDDLNLKKRSFYGTTLQVEAAVVEEFTSMRRNSTQPITMFDRRTKLSIRQDNAFFKPGLKQKITVVVIEQDGTPVISPPGTVNITFGYSYTTPTQYNDQVPFNQLGQATLTVLPPMDAQTIQVTAYYDGMTAYGTSQLAQSLSERYLDISILTASPTVGQKIRVIVSTTFEMNNPINLQVVARGNIQMAQTLTVPHKEKRKLDFEFVLGGAMAPHCRIIVYYVTDGGEIIGDTLDVTVEGTLLTPVSLTLSTGNATVEPGRKVTLNVGSRPDSLVSLLAIDKSVKIMKVANDVTRTQVYNELQSYDIGAFTYYDAFSAGIIRHPDYMASFEKLFEYAGLILFTNGLFYKAQKCRPVVSPLGALQSPNAIGALTVMGPTNQQPEARDLVQPVRIRKHFPETFLWTNVTTDENGKCSLQFEVPDTITTWLLTGIAMNDQYGIGIMDQPTSLITLKPFFLILIIPYGVLHGEIIDVQVLVFNYFSSDIEADVTFDNSKEVFQLYDNRGEEVHKTSCTQKVQVSSKDYVKVMFSIRPTQVGKQEVTFRAASTYAGDALTRPLVVKSEGSQIISNDALLVDLRVSNTFVGQLDVDIPADVIPNSEYVELLAIGDLMAPVISNMRDILQLPYGCGEQNLIYFVPDIVVLGYLEQTGALTADYRANAVSYIEQGYQQELSYKRLDGSFSAFGQGDVNGSTWLTAYVLKAFKMGRRFIQIDERVVQGAKDFLIKQQTADGWFRESGSVAHKPLQGASGFGYALTAFAVIAFEENKSPEENNDQYAGALKSAVAFLEKNLRRFNSAYMTALTTYCLHVVNSTIKDKAFDLMVSMATVEGSFMSWPETNSAASGTYAVEATAYAVLTYSLRGQFEDALPALRWLIAARSQLGSFTSSQDTVIGIQALGAVGPAYAAPPGSFVRLQFVLDQPKRTISFDLNSGNALVMQKEPVDNTARNVTIRATGNGLAIAQISWGYYQANNLGPSGFDVSVNVNLTGPEQHRNQSYEIKSCVSFSGSDFVVMGMVELTTLSGYQLDNEKLPQVGVVDQLSRVESKNDGTKLVLYFTTFWKSPKSICFTASANWIVGVRNLKNASVVAYDYYDNSKRGVALYDLPRVRRRRRRAKPTNQTIDYESAENLSAESTNSTPLATNPSESATTTNANTAAT